MTQDKMSIRRKMALVFAGGLVSLALLELAARFLFGGPRWVNPTYLELGRDFPELEQLLVDRDASPHLQYYDEFLYAALPQETGTVNFTGYYSARLTPASVPLSEADTIVWTFGGSTMENTETTDELTIANTWARLFNEALGPTHVKNFGTGGFFSSYELIKFQKLLREVPEAERPDVAIFYDGYNDALFGFQYGPGSLQKDLSLKLQALVEQDDLSTALYTGSRWLARYSKLWEQTGARAAEAALFPLPEPEITGEALAAAVRIYTRNVQMTGAICAAFDVRCLFVLQPLLLSKQPLTPLEQGVLDGLLAHPRFGQAGVDFIRDFYRETAAALAGNEAFIDASTILNGRAQPDFYDLGHTAPTTAPLIGEQIAPLLLEKVWDGEP